MAGDRKAGDKKKQVPVRNVYSNRADMADPRGSYSTITEHDIEKAVRALQGRDKVELPDIEGDGDSWAMATVMALLDIFRIRVQEGGPSALGSAQPITMRVHWPLARYQYDTTASTSLSFDMQPDYMSGNRKQQLLQMRYELCKDMLMKNLDSITKWVDIANRATTYTVKDILTIENIEQRMAALRIFGADKLVQEAGAQLLDKSTRGNELYVIPRSRGLFDEDAYFLKYQCVSTGRIYVSGIPPELFNRSTTARDIADLFSRNALTVEAGMWRGMGVRRLSIEGKYMKDYPQSCWADLAMAWKFRLSYEEYCRLSRANEG